MTLVMPYDKLSQIVSSSQLINSNELPIFLKAINISLLLFGFGRALFVSPNTSSVMSSVPAEKRGVANGIRMTLNTDRKCHQCAIFFVAHDIGDAIR